MGAEALLGLEVGHRRVRRGGERFAAVALVLAGGEGEAGAVGAGPGSGIGLMGRAGGLLGGAQGHLVQLLVQGAWPLALRRAAAGAAVGRSL